MIIHRQEELTNVLIEIMNKKDVNEMDRVSHLGYIRLRWSLEAGDMNFKMWDIIWADVMKATGCGTWNQTMDKVKH